VQRRRLCALRERNHLRGGNLHGHDDATAGLHLRRPGQLFLSRSDDLRQPFAVPERSVLERVWKRSILRCRLHLFERCLRRQTHTGV
jgi:hypothetical protein